MFINSCYLFSTGASGDNILDSVDHQKLMLHRREGGSNGAALLGVHLEVK